MYAEEFADIPQYPAIARVEAHVSSGQSSKRSSLTSGLAARGEAPRFLTQLFAGIHREATERKRAWKEVLFEIFVPLICVACTTLLWSYFGDMHDTAADFVNYTGPSPNSGVFDYSSGFCYNDSMLGPDGKQNYIPGLQPCSLAKFSFDCSGDEAQLPVRGLCADVLEPPFFRFAVASVALLNVIPSLDDVLLLHWAAAKHRARPMLDAAAYRNAGIDFVDRFSALMVTGPLYIGPAANVPPPLLTYFKSLSKYFNLVYAGSFDSVTELQGRISRGGVFAVINIKAMTADAFDVEIRMDQKAIPAPRTVIQLDYSGGVWPGTADMYIVSGFLTLQRMLYDFYLMHFKRLPLGKRHFTPYLISMGHIDYSAPKLIRESGPLVSLAIVSSLLYPVTLLARRRVVEKELRIRENMKIMGLRTSTMDISWFLLTVATMFLVAVLSVAIVRPYLRRTEYATVFLIFIVNYLTMIPFAGFVSAFFGKSRFATMMVPLVYFAASAPPVGLQLAGATAKTVFCLLPPTSFSLALGILFRHELAGGLALSDFNSALDSPNLSLVLGITTLDFFLYLLLMLYLEAVMPLGHGTPKHPLFFLLDPCRRCWGRARQCDAGGADGRDPNGTYEEMGASVRYAVEIMGLRREYKRGRLSFLAVNNLYLKMPENGIFVLLGQNGAGKSTTINMITGMTRPDAGDCLVFGLSVRQQLSQVRQNLALCPQHNILWPDLTCREHLEFFARIKGLMGRDLEDAVVRTSSEVGLCDKLDCKASALSGGQKRKLSVAAAFVGGGRLVLLDEPTAGMDVAARRNTWELLRRMSSTHTILLTTHFLDEAEILGDQVAIMSYGALKCCGSSLFLKSRLAADYNLQLGLTPDADRTALGAFVAGYVPDAYIILSGPTEWKCRIPAGHMNRLVLLLERLESVSRDVGVKNYALSAMTLEDVFLHVVANDEANFALGDTAADILWDCARVSRCGEAARMQFWALLKKRVLCAVRDWWLLSFQIICPAACILLAMVLDSIPVEAPTAVELSPSVYPFDTMSDTVRCSPYFTAANYTSPGAAQQVHFTDRNMLNSLNLSWYHVDNFLRHPLPHLSSFSCRDPQYTRQLGTIPIVIFYNTSAPHEAAIALSTLYTLVMQSAASASGVLRTTMAYASTEHIIYVTTAVQTIFKGFVILIPFTLLPANCIAWVVKERECGARHLQYLAGLRYSVYWGVNLLFDMVAYLLTVALALIIFLIFGKKAFVGSDTIGPTMLLLLTYGFAGTAMAYFLHLFFKSHIVAQTVTMIAGFVVGFLFLVIVYMLSLIDTTWGLSDGLRWPFRLMPTYAVGEGIINLLTLKQRQQVKPTLTAWSMEAAGWASLYMACEFPIFFVFMLVMDHPRFRLRMQKRSYHPDARSVPEAHEDSDVEDEREYINNQVSRSELVGDAVDVINLRKVYGNGKVAVKDITFGVVRGEVFAFLGTNGAGKTTTMSILCQGAVPTAGRAFICGHDVVEESNAARACVGYCPQFDACLDLLTVEEHLRLYAAVRGIVEPQHAEVVEALMRLCGVEEYRETRAHQLSGGNRRKLSLALALVGGPQVVMLDEPTAGMDPAARRRVWNSIRAIARSCSVLLTTHHLDEVEELANCVAIMVDGSLRCIGNQTRLKNKFGTGVEMSLRIRDDSFRPMVVHLVEACFPDAVLNEYRNHRFVYALPKDTSLCGVFKALQRNKAKAGITDYGVSQTSIEQVFIRISKEAAAC
ncbi:ABC1 transporter [Trypanosoma conorhini]|uniref:ABC1 transporter n=1 Tax=Trypanosoma conorhini TaxID=83891 RepID=A0A3R7KU96_9TRYP|nr:ABC1 transporter [Trypanosoma conorhini]RNF09836.1 ABC1 transporter [Trypanosoma conorhini]